MKKRSARIKRKTRETETDLSLKLDDSERGQISSGNAFLDHMLDIFQTHAGLRLDLSCNGDKEIDMHHSAEDIAICLGQAIQGSLGDKKATERFGFYYVTMDEALVRVALDLADRFSFVWNIDIPQAAVGGLENELIEHFFYSLAENARINLHVDLLRGRDGHHCIEAVFKAFARSFAMAFGPSAVEGRDFSTKNLG